MIDIKSFKVVIPVHKKDIHILKHTINSLLKNLKWGGQQGDDKSSLESKNIKSKPFYRNYINTKAISRSDIIAIASKEIKEDILNLGIGFLDEDSLLTNLSFTKIKSLLLDSTHTGWFFQQFLKMAYSFVCKEEFYLSWDCDSLLIKEMVIDKPFLNALPAKIPINHPYYNTIRELLDVSLDNTKQFMCEFMLFNKPIIQNLCEALNKQNKEEFYLPILDLVNKDNKTFSFSEFETYGNYALKYHMYELRFYPIYRCGGRFYHEIPSLEDELLKEFAKTYYLLQFNHWDNIKPYAKILRNRFLRKLVGFKNLMRIYYYGGFYKRDFK